MNHRTGTHCLSSKKKYSNQGQIPIAPVRVPRSLFDGKIKSSDIIQFIQSNIRKDSTVILAVKNLWEENKIGPKHIYDSHYGNPQWGPAMFIS